MKELLFTFVFLSILISACNVIPDDAPMEFPIKGELVRVVHMQDNSNISGEVESSSNKQIIDWQQPVEGVMGLEMPVKIIEVTFNENYKATDILMKGVSGETLMTIEINYMLGTDLPKTVIINEPNKYRLFDNYNYTDMELQEVKRSKTSFIDDTIENFIFVRHSNNFVLNSIENSVDYFDYFGENVNYFSYYKDIGESSEILFQQPDKFKQARFYQLNDYNTIGVKRLDSVNFNEFSNQWNAYFGYNASFTLELQNDPISAGFTSVNIGYYYSYFNNNNTIEDGALSFTFNPFLFGKADNFTSMINYVLYQDYLMEDSYTNSTNSSNRSHKHEFFYK